MEQSPEAPIPTPRVPFQPVPVKLTAAEIRTAVQENFRKPLLKRISQRALAEKLEVPVWRVYAVVHAMKKKGLRASKRRGGPDLLADTSHDEDAMLSQILDGTIPDVDERRKVAARLIVTAKDEVKLKAIEALATLEKGSDALVGPPPPTTVEGQKARVRRVIAAAGCGLAIEAFEAEFGGKVEWESYVGSRERSTSMSSSESKLSGTTQHEMEITTEAQATSPDSPPSSTTQSDT